MRIAFTPMKTLKSLLWVIFILIILSTVSNLLRLYMDSENVRVFQRLFNVDYENNIPTYYSALALLFSAIILLIIAVNQKKLGITYLPWLILGLVFMFLCSDEIYQIHEVLMPYLRNKWNLKGYFYNGWIIPYGVVAILIFLGYYRFLMKLPPKTRKLMIASGFLFVLGSIVFEMISVDIGFAHERNDKSLKYFFFMTLEELFEMLGIALFIYTLLDYICNTYGALKIEIVKQDKV